MGKELGNWVVMSVNQSSRGGESGRGGRSQFPVVVRIPYDGFLLGNWVVTPDEDKVTRTRILGCSRGGGY